MPEQVKDRLLDRADAAIGIAADIIGRFGPRVSGTESNRAARGELLRRLGEVCVEARVEAFPIHPGSLFSIGKIFAISYLAGAAAVFLDGAVAALALGLMLLCVAYFVSQFVLYGDAFDRLFKKAEAENLVGVVEPADRAERQVVLVGHHDSAPIYPFYERAAILYPIRLFGAVAFYGFCMVALSARLALLASGTAAPLSGWIEGFLILGLAVVAPMFGFMSNRGSPGASDNLIGCGIALQAAKALRGKLRATRLIVLFADGEEVGQKGSRAFARRHADALRSTPAIVLNFDTIVEESDLTILESDRNGLTPLSRELAAELKSVASELGIDVSSKPMPFGGGGTDAGQFALAGLKAASVVGIPMNPFRREILFHTSKDTPDRISRAAVAAAIDLAVGYIRRLDDVAGTGSRGGEA
jgi:aminopeptidase YwaD